MTSGIYLVHKPVGPTSFSLVQEFMKRTLRPVEASEAAKETAEKSALKKAG